MDWKYLFNLKGINFWLLGSGIGLNLIWTFVTLMASFAILNENPEMIPMVQVGMMLGILIGNFATGWITGKMADDNRGPTYGLICSLGSVALIIFVVLPGGIMGILLAAMALAGGFNGGLLSIRRYKN